jgi:hypothetical protein
MPGASRPTAPIPCGARTRRASGPSATAGAGFLARSITRPTSSWAGMLVAGGRFRDPPARELRALVEHLEDAPRRAVGWHRVGCQPSVVDEPRQIVAGPHARIELVDAKDGSGRWLGDVAARLAGEPRAMIRTLAGAREQQRDHHEATRSSSHPHPSTMRAHRRQAERAAARSGVTASAKP